MSNYRILIVFSRGAPVTGDFAGDNTDQAIRAAIEAARAAGLKHGIHRIEVLAAKRQRGEA